MPSVKEEVKPHRRLKTAEELREANARRQRAYRARVLAKREREELVNRAAAQKVRIEDHEVEVEL